MKNQQIYKDEEISLIEKLANGQTYFAEYFGEYVEQMVNNIRNDHPIELGIEFASSKVSELTGEIVELKDDLDEYRANNDKLGNIIYEKVQKIADMEKERTSMKRAFAEYAVVNGDTEKAHQLIGIGETVKMKIAENMLLSNDEKEYIIKNL